MSKPLTFLLSNNISFGHFNSNSGRFLETILEYEYSSIALRRKYEKKKLIHCIFCASTSKFFFMVNVRFSPLFDSQIRFNLPFPEDWNSAITKTLSPMSGFFV